MKVLLSLNKLIYITINDVYSALQFSIPMIKCCTIVTVFNFSFANSLHLK